MNEQQIPKDYYNKLGYLFYALATQKQPMNADNLELLKRTTQRVWAKHRAEMPAFQPSTADNVDTLYDWLNLNETPAEDCQREFDEFYKLHASEMTPQLLSLIQSTANEVAGIFGSSASLHVAANS